MDTRNHRDEDQDLRRPDPWTRQSFTFRRMTWGNVLALSAALAIVVVIFAVWAGS